MNVPPFVISMSEAEPQWTASKREMLITFLIFAQKNGRISRGALQGFAAITNSPMPNVERKAAKILRCLREMSSPPAAPQVAPWLENIAEAAHEGGLTKSTQEIADYLAFMGSKLIEGYDALPEEEKQDKLTEAMNRRSQSEKIELMEEYNQKLELEDAEANDRILESQDAESQAASVKTEVKENARTKRPASECGK
eukprot:GHVT01041107.1.p1 GENE.GHVT01041107.1~~GHVT01041107.1.p1  ORF type:complete len:197 (+),score=38.70 GHVT01041107.1:517-1107(+)